MRKPGELSCADASQHLEISIKTCRAWAQACVYGTDRTRFIAGTVRIDIKGQYWIQAAEVHRLLREEAGPAPLKRPRKHWTRERAVSNEEG